MKNIFKNSNFRIFKVLTITFSLVLTIFLLNYYIDSSYSLLKSNFYSQFNNCNFEEAKSVISEDNFVLNLKKKDFNNDLKSYFTGIVDKLCSDIKTGNITSSQALPVLKEIKTYKVLNSSIDKLILSLDDTYTPQNASDYQALLDLGISNYNSGNYSKAITALSKITELETDFFPSAQEYINKCKINYKNKLINDANKLAKDDYYTKAIDLLSKVDETIINPDDADIVSAISSIQYLREQYLAYGKTDSDSLDNDSPDDADVTTSNLLVQSITAANINTLNISSNTSKLIYVNLNDQVTYVYTGKENNWTLDKSFDCSTGIDDEPTPKGIFNVTGRGDWFFSKEFEQGGKYWVQFWGDYLFHSVPYDETQSQVLDTTLGTPASHGCIRLATEDAKWLYDNIADDTKVIIN